MGIFSKLFGNREKRLKAEKYKIGMEKTRRGALSSLKDVLKQSKKIDDALFDKLEEIFMMADIGVDTVVLFLEELKKEIKKNKITSPLQLEQLIVYKMLD